MDNMLTPVNHDTFLDSEQKLENLEETPQQQGENMHSPWSQGGDLNPGTRDAREQC